MLQVDKRVKEHLLFINPGEDNLNKTIMELLEHEYRRRLSHYENMDKTFRRKYNMIFNEFETKNIVKEKGFSWDVESDSMDWEQAIDGIMTMKKKLEELNAIRSR